MDDALLFGTDNEAEMYQITNILNIFTSASGQMINLQKSGLVCGKGVHNDVKNKLASILKAPLWESPGSYIGIPAEWGRAKSQSLNWDMEKITTRLEGWKGNLLNQAWKGFLIKAIIQSIPSYVMSILRLPKKICKKVSSTVAQF